jgi:hypothetical protein
MEVEFTDGEAGTVQESDLGLETRAPCMANRGHSQIARQWVGERGMVAMGVGHEHGFDRATTDDLQDRGGMTRVDRPGIDDHHCARTIVEHPRVGPGSGERPGVVGEDSFDPQCCSAGM